MTALLVVQVKLRHLRAWVQGSADTRSISVRTARQVYVGNCHNIDRACAACTARNIWQSVLRSCCCSCDQQ
jgi:hypothetical protein